MRQANTYELLNEETVLEYIQKQEARLKDQIPSFYQMLELGIRPTAKEIGDGNLNYVYRVEAGTESVIIKQAGPMARLSSGKEISRDRNRIESEILALQDELAPGLVPKVYWYDTVMCCCVMEDLKDYQIMRDSLLEGRRCSRFAEQMAVFLVSLLVKTSDLTKDHKKKKEMVKQFINPDLCEISERLVFNEAMLNLTGKNQTEPENEAFVQKNIYENRRLCLEAAKLKFHFMNFPQMLIHGDLHTGSIFVQENSIKIFDPEFAFFGPAGYDLGNVIAHLLLSAQRKKADGDKEMEKWLRDLAGDVITCYEAQFWKQFEKMEKDNLAQSEGFGDWYLGTILEDTAGYAGMELIRRTVGVAKTKDLAGIENPVLKQEAEREILETGIRLVMERRSAAEGAEALKKLL